MLIAKMADGVSYGAGRAVFVVRDGVAIVVPSASRQAEYITRQQAIAAAGKARWCPAAKRALPSLIAKARDVAKDLVCRQLGITSYNNADKGMISCGWLVTDVGHIPFADADVTRDKEST